MHLTCAKHTHTHTRARAHAQVMLSLFECIIMYLAHYPASAKRRKRSAYVCVYVSSFFFWCGNWCSRVTGALLTPG